MAKFLATVEIENDFSERLNTFSTTNNVPVEDLIVQEFGWLSQSGIFLEGLERTSDPSQYNVEICVNEELLKECGEDSVVSLVEQEFGWIRESGIILISLKEVELS